MKGARQELDMISILLLLILAKGSDFGPKSKVLKQHVKRENAGKSTYGIRADL